MPWPWRKRTYSPASVETRGVSVSISDPNMTELFGLGRSLTGIPVSEVTALNLSAVWRAVSLISGTIASLPLRTIDTNTEGDRRQVASWLDNPAGPALLTPFEWKELTLIHLLLHGNAYWLHLYNGAGSLAGLWPIHPLSVGVTLDWDVAPIDGKVFTVTLDGPIGGEPLTRTYTSADLTHVMAMSTDGRIGISPIAAARNSLGTALAGDTSAARMFGNGALIAGIVTPDQDITETEAKVIKESLESKMLGTQNAGSIAVINRRLKFQPWSLSAEDAQFLQSRQFQIEEIARWFGVPPHLLMQTEKQTSWGAGIAEQNLGLGRHTLMPWTVRIEQRLTRLLSGARRTGEFDYAGLERPSPKDEVALLVQQVSAGLMSVNEARTVRGLPRVAGADALNVPAAAGPITPNAADPEAVAAGKGSDG